MSSHWCWRPGVGGHVGITSEFPESSMARILQATIGRTMETRRTSETIDHSRKEKRGKKDKIDHDPGMGFSFLSFYKNR